jgi:ABC-type lipoprotein export system ATPase subunit
MLNLNRELNTTFLFATHDEKVIGYLRRKIYLLDGRLRRRREWGRMRLRLAEAFEVNGKQCKQ